MSKKLLVEKTQGTKLPQFHRDWIKCKYIFMVTVVIVQILNMITYCYILLNTRPPTFTCSIKQHLLYFYSTNYGNTNQ